MLEILVNALVIGALLVSAIVFVKWLLWPTITIPESPITPEERFVLDFLSQALADERAKLYNFHERLWNGLMADEERPSNVKEDNLHKIMRKVADRLP